MLGYIADRKEDKLRNFVLLGWEKLLRDKSGILWDQTEDKFYKNRSKEHKLQNCYQASIQCYILHKFELKGVDEIYIEHIYLNNIFWLNYFHRWTFQEELPNIERHLSISDS